MLSITDFTKEIVGTGILLFVVFFTTNYRFKISASVCKIESYNLTPNQFGGKIHSFACQYHCDFYINNYLGSSNERHFLYHFFNHNGTWRGNVCAMVNFE